MQIHTNEQDEDRRVAALTEEQLVVAWEAAQDRLRGRPLFEVTEEDRAIAFYREAQEQMKKISQLE